MGMGGVGGSPVNQVLAAMKEAGKLAATARAGVREEAVEDARTALTEMTNPFAEKVKKKRKSLKNRRGRVNKATQSQDKEDSKIPKTLTKIKNSAEKFEKKNPELKKKMLEMLRTYIKPGDTKSDILRKTQEFFADMSLTDEALEFLEETTGGELQEAVKEAKEDINERFGREIKAGKNMGAESREFSEKGLGSPTALRDMYRDITGNPREPRSLFDELTKKYPYKKLRTVIKFLFKSIGSDLKSGGPSIPKGLLHNLFKEARSLQMILGVYRFFSTRMSLVNGQFAKFGLTLPASINFESLAKMFMSLTGDRYPSPDRILRLARTLGIDDELLAKIVIFSQFRDAINEVAADAIFRSIQHRYELYAAIIEALEELEDELELKEDEDEAEEKRRLYDDDDAAEEQEEEDEVGDFDFDSYYDYDEDD